MEIFNLLGLRISYNRMLSISTALGNVFEQFELEELVYPPALRRSVFTTFTVGNTDHNRSSQNVQDSWHDTAIPATQHLDNPEDGVLREQKSITVIDKDAKLKILPDKCFPIYC